MGNFDILMMTCLVISMTFGWIRGFAVSLFSLSGWIIAWWCAFRSGFSDYIFSFVKGFFGMKIVCTIAIFVFVLVVLLYVFSGIAKAVTKNPMFHALNRSLGAVFGLFRGAFLIFIVFLFAIRIGLKEEYLDTSETKALAEKAESSIIGKKIRKMFDDTYDSFLQKSIDSLDDIDQGDEKDREYVEKYIKEERAKKKS